VASLNLPKSMCRQGFSLLIDPQNDFFLTPTPLNVVDAGKLVPDTSTEIALRHVCTDCRLASRSCRRKHSAPLIVAGRDYGRVGHRVIGWRAI
jgi:hypothetical protein